MSDGIAGGQFVGIDLHLHRSVIARIDAEGNELGWVRIDNDPGHGPAKRLRTAARDRRLVGDSDDDRGT